MKRRKLKVGRIILVVLIFAVVLLLLIFGFEKLLSKDDDNQKKEDDTQEVVEDKEENIEKQEKEEIVEEMKIDLVDYECYPNMKFNFDFIIARIRFKDVKAINYDLNKIVTNEGIKLSETKKYIDELSSNNYFVSKKNIVDCISSTETSYIATLFIPYTTDDRLVSIEFDDGSKIDFNVENNYHDINELLFEEGTLIKDDNYDIYVSNATMAYVLFKNNEFVDIPSSQKVYAFILTIDDIKDGLVLKEAKYVSDEKEYNALTKEYTSEVNAKSMFDGVLEKDNSYGLLFQVMSQDTNKITYEGELWLKFSSSDEWVKISAEFN